MRKFLFASLTAMMIAGLVCVATARAGDAGQPAAPSPAPPPALGPLPPATARPLPPGPPGIVRPPPPPRGTSESDADRIKRVIAQWEELLAKSGSDDMKKALTEGIAKAKALETTLDKRAEALKAGLTDQVEGLEGDMRAQQAALGEYFTIIPTLREISSTKELQDRLGKDNPDLSAHCQTIIDLLNKKLQFQRQMADIDSQLNTERQALNKQREERRPPPPPNAPAEPEAK